MKFKSLLAAVLLLSPAFAFSEESESVDWLAEIQTSPDELPANTPMVGSLLESSRGMIKTQRQWESRKREIRRRWLRYLSPAIKNRGAAPAYKVIQEDTTDGIVRQLIRYEVEPGEVVDAYLLRPIVSVDNAPGVVVFHSTVNHSIRQPAGIEGVKEKAFGLALAKQGFIAICPRNYLWPNNDIIKAQEMADRYHAKNPSSTGMSKMLYDGQVAIDILEMQPGLDKERIGVIGHSLGAKEVIYMGAFDDRVKVIVSSEGGVSTTFSNWYAPWYLGDAIRNEQFPHDHEELLGLIAPKPFLLVGGDSADGDQSWPIIHRALEVYRLYGKTAHIGLYNHRQGHAVPVEAEQRMLQWLVPYLK